jgi:probable phosphoglycerate mutase
LLVRHALPLASIDGAVADPQLSEVGTEMARRLPYALRRHQVTRIVSSPQRRARQTAQPVAEACNLPIDIDERLAEYDYGLPEYIPVEQMGAENPDKLARLVDGHLPDGVDVEAFKARVFSHGGVINVLLQRALDTQRIFPFRMDYVSITHLRFSAESRPIVLGVNNIEHVWDLLPRLSKPR